MSTAYNSVATTTGGLHWIVSSLTSWPAGGCRASKTPQLPVNHEAAVNNPKPRQHTSPRCPAMGASESKLVFKQGIFRLSEQANIPPDDHYWTGVRIYPPSPSYHITTDRRNASMLTQDDATILVLGIARVSRRCLQSIFSRRHTADARWLFVEFRDIITRNLLPPGCATTPPIVP